MPRQAWMGIAVAAAALCPLAGAAGRAAEKPRDPTAALREAIEPAYRKNTGLGFRSFRCPVDRPLGAGDFVDCEAVDDEGDALRYTLKLDEKGEAEVVLVSQPAAGIPAADKAALEPPCRAFLDAYAGADWKAAYGVLHPALRAELTADQAKARLEPVRRSLGTVRSVELRAYSRRVPDLHELEYAVAAQNGRALARFRLAPEGEAVKVTAFLVTAEPGSPLQAAMLEPVMRATVAGIVGQPVERLDAPLQRLGRRGDTAQGTATLRGGRVVAMLFEQSGRPDDFDPNDFTAHVLEAPLLVERFLDGRGDTVDSVECPSAVVPDGGDQACRATLAGGRRLSITIARQGGRHRITKEKPIAR